jgi:hypothetical protein
MTNLLNVVSQEELNAIENVIYHIHETKEDRITETLSNMEYGVMEKALKSNKAKTQAKLDRLFLQEFNSKNELLVFLFTDTFKEIAESIAKKKTRLVEFVTYEDVLQSALLWIMEYDFNAKVEQFGKASKFDNLQYLLSDFKNLCGQLVQREIRIKNKSFRKDGMTILTNKGFTPAILDKKEVMIDLKGLLDEKEFQAFVMYTQGYTVRDIQATIKNGRRKFDDMKKTVESYYTKFYIEQYSLDENGNESKKLIDRY